MSLTARHAGRISDDGSHLFLRSLSAWRAAIRRQKGREVYLELHRAQEPTTEDQHGYYRAAILPLLAEEWGWGDPGELHRELKRLHLPKIIPIEEWPRHRVGREEVVCLPSMADMTKEQTSAFIQAVLDQAADAGIAVPPPRGKENA